MIKKLRKKVASTVAGLEKTEDFAWGKWLKEPTLEMFDVEGFETSFLNTDEYNSHFEKPALQTQKFDFVEAYIFPELENLRPKKSKTHTVFFGLPKSQLKKIKLFDNQIDSDNKSNKIEFTDFGLRLKDINWRVSGAEVTSANWELKPNVIKINLLSSESFSVDKKSGKELNIEFDAIKSPLKIYKVKIVGLEKIKLAKIYFLKNISFHNIQVVQQSLSLLDKPAVRKEELKYFITEDKSKQNIKPEKYFIEDVDTSESDRSLELINEITSKSIEEQLAEIIPEDFYTNSEITENEIDEEIKLDEEVKLDEEIKIADEDDLTTEIDETKITDEYQKPETIAEESEEVDELDYKPDFKFLYNFQKEGANFLLNNKYAVLFDEMGLGKTSQVVNAVKNHLVHNKIKSVVIVCETNEVGSRGKIPGEVDGWLGHLNLRAGEFKAESAKDSQQGRKKQWKNLPDIFVISYDNFVSDFAEGAINFKENCFVFDEVHNLFEQKKFNSKKFNDSLNPKYLWLTSSYPKEYIKEKLDKLFEGKFSNDNYFGRKRKDVKNYLPAITWQNKWFMLDEDQIEEYNEAFAKAKEKVQWFIESGNPLRFNANVFTLIHQLKQVYNFSEKKGKSQKTKILLEDVSCIAKNQQKVVIFSQYEKAGIKKIEELLKSNNIKFLSYAPGLSTKDMETTLKKFTGSPGITALVVGVKPSRIKIPAGNISYVIHFDVWWNPSFLWQTEEAIAGSPRGDEKESLTVYSYLTRDSIEEKIHSLLFSKGLLNKNIMETVNPDSISEMLTNPEWLEIFNMPDEEFKQRHQKGLLETENRMDSYSSSEFIERGKNFFTKLGYKNLEVSESKSGNSFDLRGIYKKIKYDQQMCARFLMKDQVTEDEVNSNIAELKEITNNGKYFLITKGTFEGEGDIKSNDALLDRNLLVNYFYQFAIT